MQFGLFGPRCLLNGADAKCTYISAHIPLHHILLFVPIHHTSILPAFTFHCLGLSLYAHLSPSPFLFGRVPDQGFVSPPFSLACFCQRDTYCCILLRRIAEPSCLLNFLMTLNYFTSALFTSSQNHAALSLILIVHARFLPLGSQFFSTQCVPACNSKNDKKRSPFNCFSISRHLHTSHQSTSFIPSLPIFKVTLPFFL